MVRVEGGNEELVCSEDRVSAWEDEKLLKMDFGDGCVTT